MANTVQIMGLGGSVISVDAQAAKARTLPCLCDLHSPGSAP